MEYSAVFLDYANLYSDDLPRDILATPFHHITWYNHTSAENIVSRLQGADVVITSDVPLQGEALFEQLPQLKLILIAATGTDHIDLESARRRGIVVCHCQDYATRSLAQHTFALLLALTNRIVDYQRLTAGGQWQQATAFCLLDYPLYELAGKTLGIVGYGASGQRVAAMADAFGMQVKIAALPGRQNTSERVPLDELLPQVDVLSLHCPLTTETRGLINATRLALMKPGALLINTARGALIDEYALAQALHRQHLGGAALDVLSTEPPQADNPLLCAALPNLIITPHIAWGSFEARQQVLQQLTENAQAFIAGKPVRVVN
ncbi:MAG: Glycerate dehydrogenase [Candidatus Erwinia impunctatus]|nr:Glycerate dehydrogenase [Culicoides impunctatus]